MLSSLLAAAETGGGGVPGGVWTALGVIFTALVTGGSTWMIAKRKTSGSVETSEASEIWEESRALREQLRAEAAALRTEVQSLRTEAAEMRSEMASLRGETARLREEAAALRAEAAQLRESEARLRAEQTECLRKTNEYRALLAAAGLLDERHEQRRTDEPLSVEPPPTD